MLLCSHKLSVQNFQHTDMYTPLSSRNWIPLFVLNVKIFVRKVHKSPGVYFSSYMPVFERFQISYYWAAKSSNHSKPTCEYNQRVPWASAKCLKQHSSMNCWASTGTSKSVFPSFPLCRTTVHHSQLIILKWTPCHIELNGSELNIRNGLW